MSERAGFVVWLGEADSESEDAIANIWRILPILMSLEQHKQGKLSIWPKEDIPRGIPSAGCCIDSGSPASGRFGRLHLRKSLCNDSSRLGQTTRLCLSAINDWHAR